MRIIIAGGAGFNRFEKVNICDFEKLREVFEKYAVDSIIHLAAEAHVDKSRYRFLHLYRTQKQLSTVPGRCREGGLWPGNLNYL